MKKEKMNLDEKLLLELNRNQLINKSKRSDNYKDTSKGRNRWERRNRSKIDRRVDQYNKIDMNDFFKNDVLKIGINVHGETDDYVVNIRFSGALKNIADEIKRNNDKLEFKCVLIALQKTFNSGDVFVSCTCLHPNTKIKLLDGTTRTIEQMKLDFDSGEKLWVYSVDENSDFKPGEVENIWISGEATEFIKIILDNDKEILTTPEHLYMLRNGAYIQAQYLKENDSLMSLYFNEKNGYETVKSNVNYRYKSIFKLNHKVKRIEKVIMPLTSVYDISIKNYPNFLVDAGVILHNCKDWIYRQAFFSTRDGYNSGAPEIRASNITNPHDTKGGGCKHVNLVLGNIDWIMKIASVINNYIHYMEDFRQRQYADIIYPKLFGKPYEKDVQLDLLDKGNILNDKDTEIGFSNQYGRTRTRFSNDRRVNNQRNFSPKLEKQRPYLQSSNSSFNFSK